ncbi:hypothetical protein Pyn_07505 [Prunus yedoensis var. nudiflora]|uniref:Uncharacterized protein n=1 Tax=Prunus yedoensis var. nudiflora TaxID=2094558 RepID=A0A314UJC5_PRUYE|nr:hypothetical protein Pyn_07505 [Prunus yedoensis var. nudiflora]
MQFRSIISPSAHLANWPTWAGNYQWTEDPIAVQQGRGKNSFFPKKRSRPEEAGSGVRPRLNPKWLPASGPKFLLSRLLGCSGGPLNFFVPPPSTVLSSAGSEGRIAEAGSSAEGAGPVPQVEEAQGGGTSAVDNRTKVASTPSIPTETFGPEREVGEDTAPMVKSPTAETPAEKNDQGGNVSDDDAPRAQEDAPKMPAATSAADPPSGSASAKVSVDPETGGSVSTFISNARAKILLGKWLTLPLADKVADEQGVKVSNALDSICRASPDFATFCETAKTDLEALVRKVKCDDPLLQTSEILPGLEAELAQAKKVTEAQHRELNDQDSLLKQVCWRLKTAEARLARVQVQKRELQDAADQMLTMLSLAKEDLDKADLDVGLDLWNEKLKKIRIDRLRVDVLHFSDKIKTLLDLLV